MLHGIWKMSRDSAMVNNRVGHASIITELSARISIGHRSLPLPFAHSVPQIIIIINYSIAVPIYSGLSHLPFVFLIFFFFDPISPQPQYWLPNSNHRHVYFLIHVCNSFFLGRNFHCMFNILYYPPTFITLEDINVSFCGWWVEYLFT